VSNAFRGTRTCMNAAASHINNREVMMADTWRGSSSIVGGYQIDISGYAYDTNGSVSLGNW